MTPMLCNLPKAGSTYGWWDGRRGLSQEFYDRRVMVRGIRHASQGSAFPSLIQS